jgi:PadR family transcriptional regulator PadR
MHGFEITSWLEQRSGGRLGVADAALLRALHRLEERKLLAAAWGETKNGRRARYYKLTAAGRAQLKAESASLIAQFETMTTILKHTASTG